MDAVAEPVSGLLPATNLVAVSAPLMLGEADHARPAGPALFSASAAH